MKSPLLLPKFLQFTGAEWLFSVKTFAASMLAMYLANRIGLPRPFWAMTAVYIVSNPLAGATRSKAVFRLLGTALGCTATLMMVPTLSNSPELLSLALALWLGLCLFISLLDRTPRSYMFMLAGYTAALVGFPSVEAPTLLFDTAVARVEEIGLGIVCASVVHTLVFPVGMGATLTGMIDSCLGDARTWLADVLGPAGPREAEKPGRLKVLAVDRRRLALDITQLRLMSTHVPFDTSHVRWTAGAIAEMQDRISALTPTLSAMEDRLLAMEQADGALAPDVLVLLGNAAQWLQDGAASAGLPALRQEIQALADRTAPDYEPRIAPLETDEATASADAAAAVEPPRVFSAWSRALRIDLAARLDDLLAGWRACTALRLDIDAGLAGKAPPLRRAATLGRRVLHHDAGMALLSAFAAIVAVGLCCVFWISTAWPSGSVTAMMAGVFCCFFAGMDDPVPAIHGFLVATLWSMPIAALYVLVGLPLINDFGMLVLLCAPVFILIGCYVSRPQTLMMGLGMIVGVTGSLALHDTTGADISSFLNSNIAQTLGVIAAAQVTSLIRSVGADWSAARIRKATWRDLAGMASAQRGDVQRDAYAARMLDRISLLAPKVAAGDTKPDSPRTQRALRELRIGDDIARLQQLRMRLPRASVSGLLAGVAEVFRDRVAGRVEASVNETERSPGLLRELDRMLVAALQDVSRPGVDTRGAVAAMVGLRRNLFPEAPAALAAPVPVVSGVPLS